MIMLDDDMCLSVRPGIGCFCDRHMELLSRELGEDLNGKPLEKLMFTGGRNRYRDAWLKVMGETMRKFCRSVRDMVNTVDPTVRLGFCAGYTSWDVEGADALAICTEWQQFRAPDFDEMQTRMRGMVIVDGRNLYQPGRMKAEAVVFKEDVAKIRLRLGCC
jgi:hypothetical protein